MDDWSHAMGELLTVLESAAPFVRCTTAGVLGALANIALDDCAVVLPHIEDRRLYLGFLGNLIVSLTMAYVVDQDFRTAFFAAVCGTTTLRAFKRHVEEAFEHERKDLDGDNGSG